MEIKQIIFKKIYNLITEKIKGKNIDSEKELNTANLSDIKERLTTLAWILTEEPVKIVTAEKEGGYSDNTFFLPAKYSHAKSLEENINFYIFRVTYISIQKIMNLNWNFRETYSYPESVKRAFDTSHIVLKKLYDEYPGVISLSEKVINNEKSYQSLNNSSDLSLLYGHWMESSQKMKDIKTVKTKEHETDKNKKSVIETEFEAPAKEDVKTIEVDTESIKNYTLSHNFEKVETIEEFNGTWRDTDGADDLSEHQDALQEVDLRQTIRTDDAVHSVYRSEFLRNITVGESKSTEDKGYFLTYKEWDTNRKVYKPDFCKVFPQKFQKKLTGYTEQVLKENMVILHQLQKKVAFIFNEYEEQKRQTFGEDIDLDAMIDNFSNIYSGKSPSEKLYLSSRKRRRELSILILIDLSLSTGSYSEGKSVIETEKQAVTIFSELLNSYKDRFQIDGFFSKTRNHCDYISIKSFDESWEKTKNRLGALEPRGYTRIGPAIRHATGVLEKEKTEKKWILLLSDGKPNDYDRYEGKYGLADVKQSIKEANSKGINLFALTVDNVARNYLPLMLGHGNYRILPHPGQLPYAMEEFYAKIN